MNAIAHGFRSLWVAGYEASTGNLRGYLARVNPDDGKLLAQVAVPVTVWELGGGSIAVAEDRIWVIGTNLKGDRRSVLVGVDPGSDRVVERVPLGRGYGGAVSVASDGTVLATVITPAAAGVEVSSLFLVSPDDGVVRRQIELGQIRAQRVFALGDAVWVWGLDVGGGELTQYRGGSSGDTIALGVDVETGDEIATLRGASALAFDGSRLWVVRYQKGRSTIAQLDASSGSNLAAPVPVPALVPYAGMAGKGEALWLVARRRIKLFSATQQRFRASARFVSQKSTPVDLVVSDSSLWILGYDGNVIRFRAS